MGLGGVGFGAGVLGSCPTSQLGVQGAVTADLRGQARLRLLCSPVAPPCGDSRAEQSLTIPHPALGPSLSSQAPSLGADPAGLPGRRPGPVGSPSLHSTPWGALTLGPPLPWGAVQSCPVPAPYTGPPEAHFLRFLLWATLGLLLGSCAWGAPPPGAHHYTTCAPSPRAHRDQEAPSWAPPSQPGPQASRWRFASLRPPHVCAPTSTRGGAREAVGTGWAGTPTLDSCLGQRQGGCSQATPQQEGGGRRARAGNPTAPAPGPPPLTI